MGKASWAVSRDGDGVSLAITDEVGPIVRMVLAHDSANRLAEELLGVVLTLEAEQMTSES